MSYLLFSLRYLAVDQGDYPPVAATNLDSFVVFLNFDGITDAVGDAIDSGAFMILHEANHVLLNHKRRLEMVNVLPDKRERYLWNIAGDMELNVILEEIMHQRFDSAVYPDMEPFNFPRRVGAETYYRQLLDTVPPPQLPQQGEGQDSEDEEGQGSDGPSGDQDSKGSGSEDGKGQSQIGSGNEFDLTDACGDGAGAPTDAQTEERMRRAAKTLLGEMPDHQVKEVINKTLESGKQAGTLPKEVTERVKESFSNKVPWRQVLRNVIVSASSPTLGTSRANYRRPNRRIKPNTSHGRIFIPARRSNKLKVSVVRDTSGSMDSELLSMVNAEVDSIIKGLGASKINVEVIDCDAEVHRAFKITGADLSKLEVAEGRGGTDMMAGIHFALSRPTERPDVVVVLTDGELPPGRPWAASIPYHVPVVVCIASKENNEHLTRLVNAVPDWAQAVTIN
jgi:predicted metal-dependent peptidase